MTATVEVISGGWEQRKRRFDVMRGNINRDMTPTYLTLVPHGND